MSAWRVIRRDVGAVLAPAITIPVGALLSFCGIGIPLVVHGFGVLTRILSWGARQERGEASAKVAPGSWRVGLLATGGAYLLVAAAFGAGAVALHLAEGTGPIAARVVAGMVTVLATAAVGAALVPFGLAPFVAIDPSYALLACFTRSFELTSSLGAASAARLGARCGLALVAPMVLAAAVVLATSRATETGAVLLAIPLGLALGPPLAGAWLAEVFVREDARERRGPVALAPRLRALGLVVVPVVVALGVATLAALVTPAPMQRGDAPTAPRGFDRRSAVGAGPQRLEGTSVTARLDRGRLVVEADDGGGAGAIDPGVAVGEDAALSVRSARRGEARVFVLQVTDGERAVQTIVDRDGVRLDDGLARRLFGRLGRLGVLFLVAGLALLLGIVWTVGVGLGEARALDAPRLDGSSGDGAAGDGARGTKTRALEGTLRVAPDARVVHRPGRGLGEGHVVIEGEAWIEALGGDVRLRLPTTPVPVWRGAAHEGWDQRTVVVLSRFASLAPTSIRESSRPWPEDGRLVFGRLDDAAQELVAHARRRASLLAVPTIALLAGATAILVAAL